MLKLYTVTVADIDSRQIDWRNRQALLHDSVGWSVWDMTLEFSSIFIGNRCPTKQLWCQEAAMHLTGSKQSWMRHQQLLWEGATAQNEAFLWDSYQAMIWVPNGKAPWKIVSKNQHPRVLITHPHLLGNIWIHSIDRHPRMKWSVNVRATLPAVLTTEFLPKIMSERLNVSRTWKCTNMNWSHRESCSRQNWRFVRSFLN